MEKLPIMKMTKDPLYFDLDLIYRTMSLVAPLPETNNFLLSGGKYMADIDVPGHDSETISIKIDNDFLKVKAVSKEKNVRTVCKDFWITKDMNLESIDAVIKNGLLSISINKKDPIIVKVRNGSTEDSKKTA